MGLRKKENANFESDQTCCGLLQINGLIDFDEDYHPDQVAPSVDNNAVVMRRKKKVVGSSVNSGGSSRSSRPRSLLVNWGNMMKR